MKKILAIALFTIYFMSISYSLVYNLSSKTNSTNNTITIEWYGPTNYIEGSLYYNIYSSTNQVVITNDKIQNIFDFELLTTIPYSTNAEKLFFSDTLSNKTYIIIPIINGKYIYTFVSNVVPYPLITQDTQKTLSIETPKVSSNTNLGNVLMTNTNIITNVSKTNTQTNESEKSEKIMEYPLLPEDTKFSKIVSTYFLKKDYKKALYKFKEIRENVENLEDKEYIDLYIARCYYSLGKKRKAIYILLNIKSNEVKPLAEFWLNRFSKYFFGRF